MADDDVKQSEQSTEDEATVDTGAGDDDVVVVQQGDDLVSFQGGEEVDRRKISDGEPEAEAEGGASRRDESST